MVDCLKLPISGPTTQYLALECYKKFNPDRFSTVSLAEISPNIVHLESGDNEQNFTFFFVAGQSLKHLKNLKSLSFGISFKMPKAKSLNNVLDCLGRIPNQPVRFKLGILDAQSNFLFHVPDDECDRFIIAETESEDEDVGKDNDGKPRISNAETLEHLTADLKYNLSLAIDLYISSLTATYCLALFSYPFPNLTNLYLINKDHPKVVKDPATFNYSSKTNNGIMLLYAKFHTENQPKNFLELCKLLDYSKLECLKL